MAGTGTVSNFGNPAQTAYPHRGYAGTGGYPGTLTRLSLCFFFAYQIRFLLTNYHNNSGTRCKSKSTSHYYVTNICIIGRSHPQPQTEGGSKVKRAQMRPQTRTMANYHNNSGTGCKSKSTSHYYVTNICIIGISHPQPQTEGGSRVE
jgi:hypothetical protein